MKKTVWLGILFLAAVFAVIVWTTTGVARYRCEVCVGFGGRTACRTAAANTREEAQRTAMSNACAQVASGVTDSNQCETAPAQSVRWIE